MAACAAGLALALPRPGTKPEAATSDSARPAPATIDPCGLKLGALAQFRGVKRRQEVRARTATVTVVEDFGHHPTALHETLTSLRARFSGRRLVAVFEPRSNTARTKVLQVDFVRALAQADEVYVGAVNRAEKLAEAERFDAEGVSRQLEAQGVHAQWFHTNDALYACLVRDTLSPQDRACVVVFFSNGSFDGIIDRYVAVVTA
jgi:UDP-N-acetylmuramate: L-alanyl-gamma-D-glutamyl-meso-diaminopimelate ligase